jgi:hypothetical protein
VKKEILKRLIPTIIFLAILSLLHWQAKWQLIGLWVGGLVGTFLLDFDHLVYCFFQNPHELTPQRLRRYLQQGQYQYSLALLVETQGERKRLIFHSLLFQIVLLVAVFFVLTSSAGLLGKGLVLVIFLQSLISQFSEFLKTGKMESWFWQLKITLPNNFQALYLLLMFLIFFVFSLFLI